MRYTVDINVGYGLLKLTFNGSWRNSRIPTDVVEAIPDPIRICLSETTKDGSKCWQSSVGSHVYTVPWAVYIEVFNLMQNEDVIKVGDEFEFEFEGNKFLIPVDDRCPQCNEALDIEIKFKIRRGILLAPEWVWKVWF